MCLGGLCERALPLCGPYALSGCSSNLHETTHANGFSQRRVFIRWLFDTPRPSAYRVPGASRKPEFGNDWRGAELRKEPGDGYSRGGYIAAVLYVTMTAHTPHTTHAAHRRTTEKLTTSQQAKPGANPVLRWRTSEPYPPEATRAGVISVQLQGHCRSKFPDQERGT